VLLLAVLVGMIDLSLLACLRSYSQFDPEMDLLDIVPGSEDFFFFLRRDRDETVKTA
jgi:hypothetical protein